MLYFCWCLEVASLWADSAHGWQVPSSLLHLPSLLASCLPLLLPSNLRQELAPALLIHIPQLSAALIEGLLSSPWVVDSSHLQDISALVLPQVLLAAAELLASPHLPAPLLPPLVVFVYLDGGDGGAVGVGICNQQRHSQEGNDPCESGH